MADGSTQFQIPRSRVAVVYQALLDVVNKGVRPVVLDIGNVPASGPFVLVGNHQPLGMQDLPTLVRELERRCGVRVRGMADHFHFVVPGWRHLLVRMGAVPGTRQNCAALLGAGEPVLVFPGRARGVQAPRPGVPAALGPAHRVRADGDRGGLPDRAVRGRGRRGPLPCAGRHGQPDRAPGRALVHGVAAREDVGTLLIRGSGLAGLPGAGRLYFRFGEPIPTTPWAGRAGDRDALAECRDVVTAEVEGLIAGLLAQREANAGRQTLPRAAATVRGLLPVLT
jgi:1-acyl-sn-glycerol-3-phosphate acyltransferase